MRRRTDTSRMPYQLPFPADAAEEVLVSPAVPDDERLWVPQAEGLDFRPLLLHTAQGYWCNLLRVRRTGIVSRHRHPQPVTGYVIKGRWHYLEHDWVAEPGAFLFEPPGETHTLVVPEGVDEMITLFTVNGGDDLCRPVGGDDRLRGRVHQDRLCRAHYEKVGLGADYVEQFIR